jgi:hypothetical protein
MGFHLESAGGIVGDGHSHCKGVGQLGLELGFPGMTAATIATAGISKNEQLEGTGTQRLIRIGCDISPSGCALSVSPTAEPVA